MQIVCTYTLQVQFPFYYVFPCHSDMQFCSTASSTYCTESVVTHDYSLINFSFVINKCLIWMSLQYFHAVWGSQQSIDDPVKW